MATLEEVNNDIEMVEFRFRAIANRFQPISKEWVGKYMLLLKRRKRLEGK